ncbi:MAG: hypothetical protein AB8I08_24885 [Sandaracinaceae bacterium]
MAAMTRTGAWMARGLTAALMAMLALAVFAPPASAQNPLIARGQQEYAELRYEEALQTLSAALVRTGNSQAESATIYRLLAFTYLALQRQEEASGAYRQLLTIEPEFQPGSDVAPRFREFFDNVRSQWESEGRPGTGPPPPVSIQHRSPAEAEPGSEVELSADVEDPSGRVDRLVLAYRQGTEAVFERLDSMRRASGFSATIPGAAVAPPLVEYYFEALDATGLPIAARGDVAAPLRIAVADPNAGGVNVLEEWWFWTIIGVVVVGAVVTGIVVADQLSNQVQTGTLVINID